MSAHMGKDFWSRYIHEVLQRVKEWITNLTEEK